MDNFFEVHREINASKPVEISFKYSTVDPEVEKIKEMIKTHPSRVRIIPYCLKLYKEGNKYTAIWDDGTSNSIRLHEGDTDDKEVCMMYLLIQKLFYNRQNFKEYLRLVEFEDLGGAK